MIGLSTLLAHPMHVSKCGASKLRHKTEKKERLDQSPSLRTILHAKRLKKGGVKVTF